ncbi:helix-turn-helix domain-containing protein [Clostridium hydrogeniformans]|uniref:helix-turn-helix domain-containing protein n=1 Tax=Clostridium hydrogeniformans TaxID=349933 RepID=UPI0004867CC9|nr:helix-turn-helix domain-containing protein [Clostridium hydrogeniformans]
MKTIGDRIKELREDKCLNQQELGKMFNVHKGTISNWENGKRTPDADMIIKIADYFNVSIDYLLYRTDNPIAKIYNYNLDGNDIEIEINKNYPHNLTPQEVENLINQLKEVGFDVNKLIEKAKNKND